MKGVWMFEVYRDAKREWRWRLRAPNGRIVADCAEGYGRESAARFAVWKMKKFVPGARSRAV